MPTILLINLLRELAEVFVVSLRILVRLRYSEFDQSAWWRLCYRNSEPRFLDLMSKITLDAGGAFEIAQDR